MQDFKKTFFLVCIDSYNIVWFILIKPDKWQLRKLQHVEIIWKKKENYDSVKHFGSSAEKFHVNSLTTFLCHHTFNSQPLLLPSHLFLSSHLITIALQSVYRNSFACLNKPDSTASVTLVLKTFLIDKIVKEFSCCNLTKF